MAPPSLPLPPPTTLNPQAMSYHTLTPLIHQLTPPPSQLLPSLSQLSAFLSSYLPIRPKDVPFIYHTPNYRPPRHQPPPPPPPPSISQTTGPPSDPLPKPLTRPLPTSNGPISSLTLSITPTEGVYKSLLSSEGRPLLFLHRPFLLERRRLPRQTTVLASHTAFDEVLTVGYNTILASRLGVDVDESICLKGYKGDPERRIGIVGSLMPERGGEARGSLEEGGLLVRKAAASRKASEVLEAVKQEFGGLDSTHGFEGTEENDEEVRVVAIMNAFHPEEVERVLEAAVSNGWIEKADEVAGSGKGILYLTGQAREPGLLAALEKGMKVVCVGHRICEEWGVRFLAREVRTAFPGLEVREIFEDEELPPPRPKQEKNKAPIEGKVKAIRTKKVVKKRKMGDGEEQQPGIADGST